MQKLVAGGLDRLVCADGPWVSRFASLGSASLCPHPRR